MSDHDTFFTLSIIGTQQQVLMGRRMRPSDVHDEGLRIALQSGDSLLTQIWRERVLLSTGKDHVGMPRPQPSALRCWLERHALVIALLGLTGVAASATYWGLQWLA
jgi:hypothetical protein